MLQFPYVEITLSLCCQIFYTSWLGSVRRGVIDINLIAFSELFFIYLNKSKSCISVTVFIWRSLARLQLGIKVKGVGVSRLIPEPMSISSRLFSRSRPLSNLINMHEPLMKYHALKECSQLTSRPLNVPMCHYSYTVFSKLYRVTKGISTSIQPGIRPEPYSVRSANFVNIY